MTTVLPSHDDLAAIYTERVKRAADVHTITARIARRHK